MGSTTKTTAHNVWQKSAQAKTVQETKRMCRPTAMRKPRLKEFCGRRTNSLNRCKKWLRPCRSKSNNSQQLVYLLWQTQLLQHPLQPQLSRTPTAFEYCETDKSVF